MTSSETLSAACWYIFNIASLVPHVNITVLDLPDEVFECGLIIIDIPSPLEPLVLSNIIQSTDDDTVKSLDEVTVTVTVPPSAVNVWEVLSI